MFVVYNRTISYSLIVFILLIPISQAFGQSSETQQNNWLMRTRAVISANSDESTPPNYKIYSGIALEVSVAHTLGQHFSADLSFRTESREVDHKVVSGPADRLGSLELIPITITFQYYPLNSKRTHPYIGFGANFTSAWEKSGVLDSLDVKPHFGPALQLGLDYDLMERMIFNFNIGWNTLTTDIEYKGTRFAKIKIDPIALGAGVGFRF